MTTPPAHSLLVSMPRWGFGTWVAIAFAMAGLFVISVAVARTALGACGVSLFGAVLSNCERARVAAVRAPQVAAALDTEGEQLRRTLALLRRDLATRPACPPGTANRTDAPAILDRDWSEQRVDSLKGCWDLSSKTNVTNVQTGLRTGIKTWRICFDEQGRGRQDLTLENGQTCAASAQATFPSSSSLKVSDTADVPCTSASGNSRIFRREIECARASANELQCTMTQPERPQVRDTITLKRSGN